MSVVVRGASNQRKGVILMAQPGKGGHGSAPTAQPIADKDVKPSGGETHFGHQPGGTHGTK